MVVFEYSGYDWPLGELRAVRDDFMALAEMREFATAEEPIEIVRSAGSGLDLLSSLEKWFQKIPDNDGTLHEVDRVRTALRRLRVARIALRGATKMTPEIRDELAESHDLLDNALEGVARTLSNYVGPSDALPPDSEIRAINQVLDGYLESAEARKFTSETRDARDQAIQALESTLRAAGATAETSLAVNFSKYADREERNANMFRAATAAVLVGIAALAAALVFSAGGDGFDWSDDLGKLAISVPLAVLAGYFGREASHHRARAQWARQFEVQLLTIDAFTEPLSPDAKERLRTGLGQRVFTTASPIPGSNDPAPSALNEAAGIVESVTNLVRASQKS